MTETKKWFENWFDSQYYHVLYKHRNHAEAKLFINHLLAYLNPEQSTRFLDMACGNGRHAHYIAKKGYRITGYDLSENSIKLAKQFAQAKEDFRIHDMRNAFPDKNFDFILNLFTSFGYFDNLRMHIEVLEHMRNALSEKGTIVFDFFNVKKVLKDLVQEETKRIDGIDFHIQKHVKDHKIIKQITFEDKGESYDFKESVYAFDKSDFENMCKQSGLQITQVFGDYTLQQFDENTSPRLIMIMKKLN